MPEDLEPAVTVLRGGLLPTGWTLDEEVTSADGPRMVALVRPMLHDGEVSKYGARLNIIAGGVLPVSGRGWPSSCAASGCLWKWPTSL